MVVVSDEEDLGVATVHHQPVLPLSQTVRTSLSESTAPCAAACYYWDVYVVFAIDVLDLRKISARLEQAGGTSVDAHRAVGDVDPEDLHGAVTKEQFGRPVGVVAGEVEAGLDVAARLHAERVRDTDVAASTGAVVGASGSCPRCGQQRDNHSHRE